MTQTWDVIVDVEEEFRVGTNVAFDRAPTEDEEIWMRGFSREGDRGIWRVERVQHKARPRGVQAHGHIASGFIYVMPGNEKANDWLDERLQEVP